MRKFRFGLPVALFAKASFATAAAVLSSGPTPTEKVITLLEDLLKETQAEGVAEAKSYEEFACFCKDKTAAVSGSIKGGQSGIDDLSAQLELKTAAKGDRSSQLAEATQRRGELEAELEETTRRCGKAHEDYSAKSAELSKALSSLDGARSSMKPGSASAGLLAMRFNVKKNPDVAAAMRLIDQGPRWGDASMPSFLQQRAAVDPADPAYKYHSQGILDTLAKLHAEFTAAKADADTKWEKEKETCDKTKADLGKEMDTSEAAMKSHEEAVALLAEEMGSARSELVKTTGVLQDDKLYLADLTAMCGKRAQEYDQRSTLRGKEVEAVQQAVKVLSSGAQPAEGARVLLQRPPSLLQSAAATAGSRRSVVRAHDATGQQLAQALEVLRSEGTRLSSPALAMLVVKAAADPFGKVKGMIQKLVERLVKESTAEATKKGMCDTQLGKAEQNRDFRDTQRQKLNAEIAGLQVKLEALALEKQELAESISELGSSLEEAETERKAEKASNLKALKTAREGLAAVLEATAILKSFYSEAGKATALVQAGHQIARASPVDEDTEGAGFEGAYKGKQEQSKGVLGLLDVIKSDFERTIQKTEDAEKESASDFVEFERALKTSKSGKTQKASLDAEDHQDTEAALETKTRELQTNMDLLDEALKELESLKPACLDNGMSYEERVQKREAEMAALKRALCILDTESVEEDCT